MNDTKSGSIYGRIFVREKEREKFDSELKERKEEEEKERKEEEMEKER